jgi:hypothetical protein
MPPVVCVAEGAAGVWGIGAAWLRDARGHAGRSPVRFSWHETGCILIGHIAGDGHFAVQQDFGELASFLVADNAGS